METEVEAPVPPLDSSLVASVPVEPQPVTASRMAVAIATQIRRVIVLDLCVTYLIMSF
jgi:hypothetical protein